MGFKALTVNTAAEAAGHIYAEDDAAIFQSMFGGDGVLNIGNCLKSTVISNNKVRISDGVLSVGGHIGRLSHADYQDMTIENGATGYNRNDIIYARFLTSGNVDSFILAVKKGTATTGTASDPALVQGNLYEGAVERDYPLYRVKLSGLSIASVDQLFTVIPTIPDLKAQMAKDKAEINQSLTNVNNLKRTYLRLVLPNVAAEAKAVCDYINKNYLMGQITPMYSIEFDVIASNAEWFSGVLSTDSNANSSARTVWGIVQKRSMSADNSTLYKYFGIGANHVGSVSVIADPMFCESIPGRNQITNFLHVDLSNRNSYINKIHYFGSNNPAETFVNSPYTAGPFFGYRVVRWCSESANTYHLVTVEVHEQYPVSGRVWSNTYDISIGTWYGWKCNQGNTFIDVGTILKSSTTIAAGATVTYVATRDCFVNVSAYAHGSGQNTKIYINNVCIFSPYTNNGSDAGLVIVEKTVPLKTGQTIKIENGTYTTSAYAIFAAF
jgi:hypothetical protein